MICTFLAHVYEVSQANVHDQSVHGFDNPMRDRILPSSGFLVAVSVAIGPASLFLMIIAGILRDKGREYA